MNKLIKSTILKKYLIFLNIFIFIFISNVAFTEENTQNTLEFKSIKRKSDNANMRVGPGKRFEILWNFKKPGLPIKIHKTFDHWYQVETPDGSVGWMWRNLISDKEKTIIFLKNEKIYKNRDIEAKIIAYVEKNSILKIHYCKKEWCKVESKEYKIIGFVQKNKNSMWGAYIFNSN